MSNWDRSFSRCLIRKNKICQLSFQVPRFAYQGLKDLNMVNILTKQRKNENTRCPKKRYFKKIEALKANISQQTRR